MLVVEEPAIDLATPTGPMRTYLYRPASGARHPGVVLYSEIYQRTAPIHRMAMIVAGHGYLVAVPEIFHARETSGTALPYDDAGTTRGNAHKAATPPSSYDADLRVLLDHLAASPRCTGTLGALGVCIGGHLAFRAALDPRIRATACFYATNLHDASLGGGDDSLARASEIRGELMMVWGRQDPHIPDAGRAAIHASLTASRASFSWHEHNAQHAFLRDEGHRYDPELALQSYAQLIALFRRCLT